ncbi:MAG TPA: EAL domain-containing protein, partial [Treponema sp.]|nr:EAL domain-containing protein [Treponema sp.]
FNQEEIPFDEIQFEVTESAFLERAGVSVANLSYLRSKGCRIAMDDFGTGYSNLGYLRNLPIDKIKVDKAFIDSVPGDDSAEGLLKAMYDIGKSYTMQLVAEGVETEKQRDFLYSIGFDEFQGFLYSQGLPCNDLLRYLDSAGTS